MTIDIEKVIGRLNEFADDHRLIGRIHETMVKLDHKWAGCGVPTIDLVRSEVANLAGLVAKNLRKNPDAPHAFAGTGGLNVLYIRYSDDSWTVELIYSPVFLTKGGS